MKKRSMFISTFVVVIILSAVFFSFKLIYAYSARGDLFLKTKILTDIIWLISDEYVDEVDTDLLFNKAIKSLTDELDPHSQYVPPSSYENMSERFMGYAGIGVQFGMIDDRITVRRVLRNGPSERAGLKLGDRIIEIEGEDAIGLEQDDVPKLLKGPQGTRVKVTIEREGAGDPFEVEITRGQAFVETIKYFYMLDEETGYINLERFAITSISELEDAIRTLQEQGMKRLVFDLRFNGGGLLPQAKEIADKFLDGDKMIVETKGRTRSSNQVFTSTDNPEDFEDPVIVLTNEESASASEIVSGALQDWDRGLIVGSTTFGKGLMQAQIQFEDGSALLLTTGRWFTPLGRLIQKDYTDKTMSEYQAAARSDSLNKAREQDVERPQFTTPGGRTVYGGGGIAPDIEITSSNQVSSYVFNVESFSAEQPIFRYAQKLAVNNPDRWSDVYDLMENFSLEGTEYDRFQGFLDEIGFQHDDEDIDKTRSDFEKYIEARTAEFLWGDEPFWRAIQVDDNVLKEAVNYFSEAEALLRH
ncbi:S41 family peptidase [candidate division KSB1 bacterium]